MSVEITMVPLGMTIACGGTIYGSSSIQYWSVEITMGLLGINMRSVVFNMGPIYDQYGVGRTNNRPIEPVRD